MGDEGWSRKMQPQIAQISPKYFSVKSVQSVAKKMGLSV
jgi:hypothetical protein